MVAQAVEPYIMQEVDTMDEGGRRGLGWTELFGQRGYRLLRKVFE